VAPASSHRREERSRLQFSGVIGRDRRRHRPRSTGAGRPDLPRSTSRCLEGVPPEVLECNLMTGDSD
jgi:hypothetical protein